MDAERKLMIYVNILACSKAEIKSSWSKNINLLHCHLPRWPSWLDCGALINVDAPGCGTSVVRGPTVHK